MTDDNSLPQPDKVTTVTTALGLTEALHKNTIALKSVKRRYRISLAILAFVVLLSGYTIKSKHDNDVTSCNRGNELRGQIDEKFGTIAHTIEIAAAASPNPDDPNTKTFLTLLRADLPTRDCSDLSWF